MRPAGIAAFERRSDDKTAIYSYEQRQAAALEPEQERRFRADARGVGVVPGPGRRPTGGPRPTGSSARSAQRPASGAWSS